MKHAFEVASADPDMPRILVWASGHVSRGQCGRYSLRVESENDEASRIDHELRPLDGWNYTREVVDIFAALVWSAVRRDRLS